jgi:D-glycero-D-manno-heptose 1,7-bisphosphate phosphatase
MYEAPKDPDDYAIFPYVPEALRLLKQAGFLNIIVSNQPDYAKGKANLENLRAIATNLESFSRNDGCLIDTSYYCYHHPEGIVPEYTKVCRCRKPGTLFLKEALAKYQLDVKNCWFIGDSDVDIECGKRMGIKTISINYKHSAKKRMKIDADFSANDLYQAVCIVLMQQGEGKYEFRKT